MKITAGKPGTSANSSSTPAAIINALGWRENWLTRSCARFSRFSPGTRVTTMPAAIEMISAGICAIRPSPIDSTE